VLVLSRDYRIIDMKVNIENSDIILFTSLGELIIYNYVKDTILSFFDHTKQINDVIIWP
jgi:hypothetical protein